MDRETIAVSSAVVVALIGIFGAIFLWGSSVYYSRRNKHAPQRVEKILEHCQKVLRDVEPDLGKETEFYYDIEIEKWGKLPWQQRGLLSVMVKLPQSERSEAVAITVEECLTYNLDLPANRWLWAAVEFNSQDSSGEKPWPASTRDQDDKDQRSASISQEDAVSGSLSK